MCDDVDVRVRDFRADSIDRTHRGNVSYLRSDAPASDDGPLRVHPIETLYALSTQSTDAIDAWARHAAAVSGFGEAPASDTPVRRPASFERWSEARADRARALGEAIAAAVWVTVWLVGSVWRSWQRRRAAARTYESLASLDDRELRDLGVDRSEISSVAAEVHGRARQTRMRARPVFGYAWLG